VHQGLDVRVGDDDHPLVPAGLMLGVRMMAEGQGCVVRCAAKYGYGGEGWTDVPPGAALEYEVRMLECRPASAPVSDLEAATERKELGNLWYRAGRYPRASRCYKAGTQLVGEVRKGGGETQGGEEETAALLEVAVALGNNLARSEEKMGRLSSAKDAVIGVLMRDPENTKALLAAVRLSCAAYEMLEADAALQKCKEILAAKSSKPADAAGDGDGDGAVESLAQEVSKAERLVRDANRRERQREKSLFGGKLASKQQQQGQQAQSAEEAGAEQKVDPQAQLL
jgi:hypothetical protein